MTHPVQIDFIETAPEKFAEHEGRIALLVGADDRVPGACPRPCATPRSGRWPRRRGRG